MYGGKCSFSKISKLGDNVLNEASFLFGWFVFQYKYMFHHRTKALLSDISWKLFPAEDEVR